jgi:hypothetical protein
VCSATLEIDAVMLCFTGFHENMAARNKYVVTRDTFANYLAKKGWRKL